MPRLFSVLVLLTLVGAVPAQAPEPLVKKVKTSIAKAFNVMVLGDGEAGRYIDPVQGIKQSYNNGVTDEFIVPFVVVDNRGEPVATA